jgi:prevent-host-death family protein
MTDNTDAVTARELNRLTGATLDRVLRGRRVLVVRNGRPVALLVPVDESGAPLAERRGAAQEPAA